MRLPYPVRTLGRKLLGPVRVPVLSGLNEGRKWSLATLGRGYGSGRFAVDRLAALAAVSREGDCFWDVGAHKGFVTLAASRMVGPVGEVVAVEPSSANLEFLRRHLEWNGVRNVRVLSLALSDHLGEAAFGGRGSSIAYRIGRGDETVRVSTVEAAVEKLGAQPPSVMKVDVEGEEAAVLRGAGPYLGGELALLVSTHGRARYEECARLLRPRGFRIFDSWELARRAEDPSLPWSSDHDFLAIGPERHVDEEGVRSLRLISGA